MGIVKKLDFLVNERGLSYDMIASFCGNTRQRWHQIHNGEYSCSINEIMPLVKFVTARQIFNGSKLKKLFEEYSMSKDKKVGGHGKTRPKPEDPAPKNVGGHGKTRKPKAK